MQLYNQKDIPEFHNVKVTVRVGQEDIGVCDNIIRRSSDFMATALKGPWDEAQERVIHLPTLDPSAFKMYYPWLISGRVHCKPSKEDGPYLDPTDAMLWERESELLQHAFHVGHHFLDIDIVDTLSDVLLQITFQEYKDFGLCYETRAAIYGQAPEHSPVKKLVVDLIVWTVLSWGNDYLIQEYRCTQPQFVIDVLDTARKNASSSAPSPFTGWETSCKYHSHGKDRICYKRSESESAKKRSGSVWNAPESSLSRGEKWKKASSGMGASLGFLRYLDDLK